MSRRRKRHIDHPELGLPETRELWQTHGLFSDHYLKTRIRKNSWWPGDEQVRPIWEYCRDLYNKRYVVCAKNNEAFTRQELLDKILAKLGFAWTDNLGLPAGQQDLEPDYIIYASAEDKEKVIEATTAKRYASAVAVMEAKKVHHPLSQISKHQQRYPHQQIRDYLSEAQVLSWGILTNGNEWRLYCRDAKPSEFFALHFDVAIQSLDNFRFFVALFSPATFVRDAQGKCRLDHIRESALTAQSELEADLRVRIFGIVETLANGFMERSENRIADSDLARLYNNCLIYLYRLLFILYAEGRQLLPIEPPSRKYYKQLSIARLVSTLKSFSDYFSRTQTRLCREINDLCRIINGADTAANEEFDVPRYNGGLFDPSRYPDLERWEVSDAVLADVLRGLMFNPLPDRQQPSLPIETVDYADLSVQQLGSIYEGLLEHHFARENGRLALKTDKAERKATGTYYTPDYIVKYIVDQTIGPLVREIEQCESVKSARAAGRQDNSFAEEALKLNICDPAMGSGHFLVEATIYLADHIVYHPTTRFQAEFKAGESQEQAEIAFWRRRVVEACIYGVDLNPLAVELAKLSLWLVTIATNQPLNFLDHHFRCGNSLIGAHLDQLNHLPIKKRREKADSRQIEFTFGPDFKRVVADTIRQIQRIEAEASGDVAAVKDKERLWNEVVTPALASYKAVADLWTGVFFGNPMDEMDYIAAAQKILAGQLAPVPSAASRHFFHWELEFPEVFFNDDGTPCPNPGFDAVIGNPPYISFGLRGVGKVGEDEKEYYLTQFGNSAEYKISLYALFIGVALKLTRLDGHQGYIVPDSFLLGKYFSRIREYILAQTLICSFILFHEDFWKSGTVGKPVVYVTRKRAAGGESGEHKVKVLTTKSLEHAVNGFFQSDDIPQKFFTDSPLCRFRLILGDPIRALFKRIESVATPLEKLVKFYSGLIGLHGQDTVTLTKKPADYSPEKYGHLVASSGNLQRYSLSYEGLYCPKDADVYKSGYKPEIYENPKLFLNQTGDHLKCYFDTERYYCLNNMHVGYPTSSEYNLRYANALICSRLFDFYYKSVSLEEGRANAQTDIDVIDGLPIHWIAFTTPASERKRLAQQSAKLYDAGVLKGDVSRVQEFVDKQFAADHTDIIHDLLAFLAERMMALNKDKHNAVHGFLTDFKDFHGVDTHSLKPKTKLDEFWKLKASELFDHLRKNVRTLAQQDVRLKESDEGKIRARFQQAKDKIVPMETALTFTDGLIDQIVYRLYGLTPEEVRIVETSPS